MFMCPCGDFSAYGLEMTWGLSSNDHRLLPAHLFDSGYKQIRYTPAARYRSQAGILPNRSRAGGCLEPPGTGCRHLRRADNLQNVARTWVNLGNGDGIPRH